MNTRTSLITITSLSAAFIALCAAVFSVTGLTSVYAGVSIGAALMASALELGKLVGVSLLYQYWTDLPKLLRHYLTGGAAILMLVTSAGIYGYLSTGYAKSLAAPTQLTADIQSVNNKVTSIDQDIQRKNDRLNQIITLRKQQETRLDTLIAKSTSGNTNIIRSAQVSLSAADKNVTTLQKEISDLSNQRDSLKSIGINKQVTIDTDKEIGAYSRIAKVLGTDLDTVVKWLTLIIVLVFDPFAVALVLAVNFLVKRGQGKLTYKEELPDIPEKLTYREEPVNTPLEEPAPELPQPIVETPLQPPPSEQNDLKKYLDLNGNGIPDWMEDDYNWDNTEAWINNPIAKLYKQRVIDKHR